MALEEGKKISELQELTNIQGTEYLPVQAGGENKKLKLQAVINEYNVSKFHPAQGIDGSNRYTLETAIVLVPSEYRTIGIKCAFVNEDGQGESWEYMGGSWVVNSFSQVGAGKITDIENRLNYFFSIPKEYFTENGLNITGYSFLYIQQGDKEKKYKRYVIKKGGYSYPSSLNTALVVSTDNFDSMGLLVTEVALTETLNSMFIIGYTDSRGVFHVNGNSDLSCNIIEKGLARLYQPYFSFHNFTLTSTEISFNAISFLYLKGQLDGSKYYKRYIIKPGTYSLPTEINRALAVSLNNKDESGYLIPYITTDEIDKPEETFYMIGFTDSSGIFHLCDTAIVYDIIIAAQQTATAAQQTATALSQSFEDKEVSIIDTVRFKNKGTRLLKDGTLLTGVSNYLVVSDFIELIGALNGIIATFNTDEEDGNNVAFAFYSDKNEESFISYVNTYTETILGAWRTYNGVPEIPENAKYIRISGNTTLNPESPNIEMLVKELASDNIYSDAPSSGYEYFSYDVDTAKEDVEDSEQGTEVIYSSEISKDNGFIRLPESYTKTGEPTRLIIVNHGAGGKVTENSSENGNTSFVLLLQKKGYAVLCINGVPEAMRNTKYMDVSENGASAHMGGWVYIRSALAAYKYVTEKYNIAKDGCYVIGRSMGGVTSLNLALSGVIPVKALALDAPVIDSFHDAYFSGTWSGGTLGGKNPAIFAWIFQWDYCNFNDDTYTIPTGRYDIYGQSYNVESEETKSLATLKDSQQDMAILWHLNENKMYGYNAYKTGDFLIKNLDDSYSYNLSTDNDEQYYGKKLPCPCKIWFGSGDTVNQIDIAKRFIKKIRNGGSIAILRTCPTNRHAIWNETETVPDGLDISVVEDGITCSPYGVELWNWIKRWDGNR